MGAWLLRDAVRRLGAGIAIAVLPLAWLWRSHPPWDIRAWLWSRDDAGTIAALVGLPIAWAILTAPLVRLLLRSARLEYWRQFPIPRAQWFLLHARNLLCIDVPGVAVAGYLFAPLHDRAMILGASVAALLLALAAQIVISIAPLPRMLVSPRARTKVGALVRLYVVAVLRRDRAPLWLALALQVGAIAYAWIGVGNVAHDEPAAAQSLIGGAAVLCCVVASWLVLRAQRAVDRDRWYLDAQAGVDPITELLARVLVGIGFAVPLLVGLGVAAVPLGGPAVGRAVLSVIAVAIWAAVGFVRIGARAEARLRLHTPQHVPATLLAAYGLAVVLVLDPLALLLAAAAEVAIGRRALVRATLARTRFETTQREDDHG
jgi:hypothetical protein